MLAGIWALPSEVSGPPRNAGSRAQSRCGPAQGHRARWTQDVRGALPGREDAARRCSTPDHMFSAYLCVKNILAQMLHGVLNCKLNCLIVSLVWYQRQQVKFH